MCLSRSRVKTFSLPKKHIQNVSFGVATRHIIGVETTLCAYWVVFFKYQKTGIFLANFLG